MGSASLWDCLPGGTYPGRPPELSCGLPAPPELVRFSWASERDGTGACPWFPPTPALPWLSYSAALSQCREGVPSSPKGEAFGGPPGQRSPTCPHHCVLTVHCLL